MTDNEESASSGTVRILVIDDNRDAADSLALLFELLGFEVRAVYDGQEGLKAAREYRPDCVVSDIGLPGIDGYQLAEQLRQDESFNGIPLIAITAHSEETRARSAGFDYHFVKPADPHILGELLRNLFAMNKRLERAEELVQKQGEVVVEARDLIKEVKQDLKEVKQDIREVKEVKQDIREVKEAVKDIKEKLREVNLPNHGPDERPSH